MSLALQVHSQDIVEKPSVFDLPKLQGVRLMADRAVAVLFAKQKYGEAERVLRKAIERLPYVANLRYNLACALARQGDNAGALAALEKAVELGFRDPDHIEKDPDLEGLRDAVRFKQALKAAAGPAPEQSNPWKYEVEAAEPVDGVAMVTEKNVAWDTRRRFFRVYFKFAEKPPADRPIAKGLGKVGELLRAWYKEGTAAGNHGDLYDNHDSDHSNMDCRALPQFTRIEFGEEAKKRKLNHGLQLSMLYNGVTLGNSSTALTAGPAWRSQGRHLLMTPRGPRTLFIHYGSNHLYFYPEHCDHDPGRNGGKGHGDLFPANTPYMIVSQGSSGSDKAFMNAVGATLAAFRPEVKTELKKKGMLMPTVQMVFRMSNKTVESPDDYLTGKAHPSVFRSSDLDVEKMVKLAHDMKPDALAPFVALKVVEEDESVVGRDYFDVAPRERLLDTPCAIARVVKSSKYMRRMVVSAEASKDLLEKPLTYRWVVLRGDAGRIRVRKLNDAGSLVELLVPYHERAPVRPGSDLESNRVDIGAFVHNGTYYSPPAFVSLFYLDNEKRVYDDENRIRVVDYTDPEKKENYVDPVLDFRKDWRDEYRYGEDGRLLGWTRIRAAGREQFTAEGRLIVRGTIESPEETREIRYTADNATKKVRNLKQQVVDVVMMGE